jgi:hypothetical protein
MSCTQNPRKVGNSYMKRFRIHNRPYRAGGVVQVIECLPSKHKALSSNPSTTKIKNVNNNKIKLLI